MDHLLLWLFPGDKPRAAWNRLASAVFLALMAAYSLRYFTIPVKVLGFEPGFLHGVHLVIHEAGHAICIMVGAPRTFMVFMGSGFQVLFPLIIAGAFYWKNHDSYGTAVCLWWTGHATLDVAPYVADARALELPLLGGGTGREVEGHDWEYLLTQWHAMESDTRIGAWVALAGRTLMFLALAWGAATLVYETWFWPRDDNVPDEQLLRSGGGDTHPGGGQPRG